MFEDRDLSEAWTGFTQFTILNEKPPDGYTWSGRRLTKMQTTSRSDHLWPAIWSKMSKAAQRKEKQEWAIEKPKLDNARILRGIDFIDQDDVAFKETWKNFRQKLKVPMEAAVLCKVRRDQCKDICGEPDTRRSKYACIVEANESTRRRLEGAKDHEDHIAGKGFKSLSHYNLVRKFILLPQALKIPEAKAAVDKEWEKLEQMPAWQLTKVRSKKESFRRHREGKNSSYCYIDGAFVISRIRNWNRSFKNTKAE